jgi:hypothetical protein
MSGETPEAATWPGSPYDLKAKDFTDPLTAVLRELHVLEDKGEGEVTWNKTPFSYQVITAGATRFSRNWSTIVGALGGAGTIGSIIKALGYNSDQPAQAAAFTASAAFLLSATTIAIAIMVRADVGARGQASAAQYAARATIASAMMASSRYGRPIPTPPPPPEPRYMLKTKDAKWYAVKSFELTGGGRLAAVVGPDDSRIPGDEIDVLVPTNSWGAE